MLIVTYGFGSRSTKTFCMMVQARPSQVYGFLWPGVRFPRGSSHQRCCSNVARSYYNRGRVSDLNLSRVLQANSLVRIETSPRPLGELTW